MPRRKGKGVDLVPLYGLVTTAFDGLAASTQATMKAQVIENVNTSEDYGSGSIKGLRMHLQVKPEAVIEFGPQLFVLILPSGMAVPDIDTAADIKKNERFLWGDAILRPYTDPAATSIWWVDIMLKTARRFHSGDVLTFVVRNRDNAVAFGAAAVGIYSGRVYVSED